MSHASYPGRLAPASLKQVQEQRRRRGDPGYPGRLAPASLKQRNGEMPDCLFSCYPGRLAPASLKQRPTIRRMVCHLRYPGRLAPASLKPLCQAQPVPLPGGLSGATRPGLIEALFVAHLQDRKKLRYPGRLAPASLKHGDAVAAPLVAGRYPGRLAPASLKLCRRACPLYFGALVIRGDSPRPH